MTTQRLFHAAAMCINNTHLYRFIAHKCVYETHKNKSEWKIFAIGRAAAGG